MKIASLAEVKNRLSYFVEASSDSPIVITKNGKPVAAIVNIASEDDLDSLLLAHSPRFQRLLADADASIDRSGGLPLAEIKRRLAAMKSGS